MLRFFFLSSEHAWKACIFLAGIALSAPSASAATASYTYDALGRLVTVSYDTGVCIVYSYDGNGNRTAQTIQVTASGGPGVWGCFAWGNAKWQ
jgi:YD repeat-containing protein